MVLRLFVPNMVLFLCIMVRIVVKTGDADYPANAYCAGQLLLDGDDPYKVLIV